MSLTLCSPGLFLAGAAVVLAAAGVVLGCGNVVEGSVVVVVGVGVVVAICVAGVGTGVVWFSLRAVSPVGILTCHCGWRCDMYGRSNTQHLRQLRNWHSLQDAHKHPHLWSLSAFIVVPA